MALIKAQTGDTLGNLTYRMATRNFAPLMAMADVFDALISRRVYKEAFPFSSVRNIIAEERGRLFDPDIADAFLTNCGEFEAIALHFGIER